MFVHAKAKNAHIGGLIGNVTNNGGLTLTINQFSNTANLSSYGDSYEGGLIGLINGNAKYEIQISECINKGHVVAFGQTNSVSGIIGRVTSNRNGTIILKSLTNLGTVNVKEESDQSYLGGVFGSVEQNPQMQLTLETISNYGTVESCGKCKTTSGGLCGFIDLVDDGTFFSLTVVNSINSGPVISSKAIDTISCGLFCVSSRSMLYDRIVEVKNSINKGMIVGSTSFGIGTEVTGAECIVSMGFVDGISGDAFFSSCSTIQSLFVLEELESSFMKDATLFLQ